MPQLEQNSLIIGSLKNIQESQSDYLKQPLNQGGRMNIGTNNQNGNSYGITPGLH